MGEILTWLVLGLILFGYDVPSPISYDNAEIPNNSRNVKVGLGVGYDKRGFYYTDFILRADIHAGYGMRRFVEAGVDGGIGGGYCIPPYGVRYYCISPYLDIYPYIKLGIPTDPVRFSIKPSLGGRLYFPLPILSSKLDILMGVGKPEYMTLGVSLNIPYLFVRKYLNGHIYGAATFFASLHLSTLSLSLQYRQYHDFSLDEPLKVRILRLGISKSF